MRPRNTIFVNQFNGDSAEWIRYKGGLEHYVRIYTYGRMDLEDKKEKDWSDGDDRKLYEIIRDTVKDPKTWTVIQSLPKGKGF